jgi:hypothetical protein
VKKEKNLSKYPPIQSKDEFLRFIQERQ